MITAQPVNKRPRPDETGQVHLDADKNIELSSVLSSIRSKQKEHAVEVDARQQGQLYINLLQFPISKNALLLIERRTCDRERVVCYYTDSEHARFGSPTPGNPGIKKLADDIETKFGIEVTIYRISDESFATALKKYDAIPKLIAGTSEGLELTEETLRKQQEKVTSIQKISDEIARTPVTDVLALIVGSALKAGASDIHIEAEADDIKLRLRIDGVLHDIGILPKEAWSRVISRIKLIAGLKLNILNKPQDGRFTIHIDQDRTEVRTSTVPTSYGESVVMRLLRFSMEALQFDNLGLTGYTYTTLDREISKPNGMIISSGPTGSGKTTTLYAILHILNTSETKILTLEDPVEYKLKGINQTQINPKEGVDFAKGLRSLLRQDPDIIMVGEIRDLETADTAINAALTGHLMLSTLHTNSAAGAIPRFLAMGSKNFLLAPSINALIGQRLVRRLCQNCKRIEKPDQELFKRVTQALEPIKTRTDLGFNVNLSDQKTMVFYVSSSCDQCHGLGYKGRIGIFEIMTMSKDLEKLILAGSVSEYEIQELAQQHGMVTMLQDGLIKALAGITSLSEVFRVAE